MVHSLKRVFLAALGSSKPNTDLLTCKQLHPLQGKKQWVSVILLGVRGFSAQHEMTDVGNVNLVTV